MSMVSVKVESLTRKAESARIIELSETLMRWEQSHSVAYNLASYSEFHSAQVIVAGRNYEKYATTFLIF